MILGIMQPYFFPYVGYFQLIANSDRWVVFDVVQYNSKSWMNRNRVLHPASGWQYINVPVRKSPHGTPIHDISVVDLAATRSRILGQLKHYEKYAPYFTQVVELINKGFINTATDRLVDLNVTTISVICVYLGIDFNWSLCSEMDLELDTIDGAGQWALSISEQLGVTDYVNPSGGENLFDPDDWSGSGIRLHIYEAPDWEYSCEPYQHEKNLSILDVLMWNDPGTVRNILARPHVKRIYEPVNTKG